MFTGIIESLGKVTKLEKEEKNLHITVEAAFASELKIDQSVAHNGVCLTVVEKTATDYKVTAIDETLQKTTFSSLETGDWLNLERGMKLGDRLDGHIVQGHVDQVGVCTEVIEQEGSHLFRFDYSPSQENLTIPKGSITIDGVSLTVVDSDVSNFSVAIIPYTLEHTSFKNLKPGIKVNLEFDVIGKYVQKLLANQKQIIQQQTENPGK